MLKKFSLASLLFVLSSITSAQVIAACVSSSIKFPVPFLGNDEVFQLADGDLWQVMYEYQYLYAYYPSVQICPDTNTLLINGKSLKVQKVADVSNILVESFVSGTWRGWGGDTIVTLTNGQQWKQSGIGNSVSIETSPKVRMSQ